MILIIENESELKRFMLHPEKLPDVFAIADTETEDRSIRSMLVCMFDKKGILYLVDSIDQEESDTYHLSVPYSEEGSQFIRVLTGNAELDENGIIKFIYDQQGRNSRVFKRYPEDTTVRFLHAQSKCFSPKVTETLKEVMVKFPITYHFGEPQNRLDAFFVGVDPGQINIISSLKLSLDEIRIRELNVFPIALQLAEGRNRFLDNMVVFSALFDASLGASFLISSCFGVEAETEDGVGPRIHTIGACLLLKNLAAVSYRLFDARYETFERCNRVLKTMSERNKAVSEASLIISNEVSLLLKENAEDSEEREETMRQKILLIQKFDQEEKERIREKNRKRIREAIERDLQDEAVEN